MGSRRRDRTLSYSSSARARAKSESSFATCCAAWASRNVRIGAASTPALSSSTRSRAVLHPRRFQLEVEQHFDRNDLRREGAVENERLIVGRKQVVDEDPANADRHTALHRDEPALVMLEGLRADQEMYVLRCAGVSVRRYGESARVRPSHAEARERCRCRLSGGEHLGCNHAARALQRR